MKTAVIAGSTGLVGSQLLSLLLEDERYSQIVALSRREFAVDHPKLTKIVAELRRPDEALRAIRPDDVFCCLGTTMSKAGSREKFYEADFELPMALARATKALGAKQYLIVSALGANKNSAVYYNRVKGELEQALNGVGFEALHIFRPSLLLGPRKEQRAGEDAAKIFFRIFGFLVPEKYKAIDALSVARAMAACASQDLKGVFIYESRDIQNRWGTRS